MTQKSYEINAIAHPFTGIHLTEKGLNILENYVKGGSVTSSVMTFLWR